MEISYETIVKPTLPSVADWKNKYRQPIYFTRFTYWPWRSLVDSPDVAKQHEVMKFVDPIGLAIDHYNNFGQSLIYHKVLKDEMRSLELGHSIEIIETPTDKEFAARFQRGYLSTSLHILSQEIGKMCRRYKEEINKEEQLYRYMKTCFDDENIIAADIEFFNKARNKVAEYYKALIENIKYLQSYELETKK